MLSALLAWSAAAPASETLRCGSRLVSVEDRAADLLSVCGEPAFRDRWSDADGRAAPWVRDTEEWTYNFGPSQLLRILRLRRGRIVDISSDGYGFPLSATVAPRCSPDRLVEGQSKYRLLMSCGEPLARTAVSLFRPDQAAVRRGWSGPTPVVEVFREEWVYDFGPNLLRRIVTLENGRVTDVENGGRGGRN